MTLIIINIYNGLGRGRIWKDNRIIEEEQIRDREKYQLLVQLAHRQ